MSELQGDADGGFEIAARTTRATASEVAVVRDELVTTELRELCDLVANTDFVGYPVRVVELRRQ